MLRPANREPDNRGHDDTSTIYVGPNTPKIDDANSQSSHVGQSSPIGAQIGHTVDPTNAGDSSDQTRTPQTETASHDSERPFVCEWLQDDGNICTRAFKRRGDLTRHRNSSELHAAQAQANADIMLASKPQGVVATNPSTGGLSSKPKINVTATIIPIQNNATAEPRSSEKTTRKIRKNPQRKASSRFETNADTGSPINTKSHIGAMASAQNSRNLGNPYPVGPQPRQWEVSSSGAQSSLSAGTPQQLNRTARMMLPGYGTETPIGPFNFFPPGPLSRFVGPNEPWRGPLGPGVSPWPPDYQLPPSSGGPGFTHQNYAQYQAPALQQQQGNFGNSGPGQYHLQPQPIMPPQHDPYGRAGSQLAGWSYPQYQAPMQSQQTDNLKPAVSEGATYDNHHRDNLQELPQQRTVDQDNIDLKDHGFVPEQDHFEENCFGVEGSYCCACRARFLEWFPTSDFCQFVEEICVSEKVEFYPPVEG